MFLTLNWLFLSIYNFSYLQTYGFDSPFKTKTLVQFSSNLARKFIVNKDFSAISPSCLKDKNFHSKSSKYQISPFPKIVDIWTCRWLSSLLDFKLLTFIFVPCVMSNELVKKASLYKVFLKNQCLAAIHLHTT